MTNMHTLTGLIYGSDFHFHPGEVRIEGEEIREVDLYDGAGGSSHSNPALPSDESYTVLSEDQMNYIIPGLVDIHFHGCMGMDFCDGTEEALRTIAEWEVRQGVTSICPATLTLPAEELVRILGVAAGFISTFPYADLIGVNMEGPFISYLRKGAQNEEYIRRFDADLCRAFLAASDGLVKLIGIAPEENPGFEGFIRELKGEVRISLAHTNADYDTSMRAFKAGASHVVHLFNAMPEMLHREPGVVGAILDNPHVTAELICDGNHVHPSVVRAVFAMLGEERVVLISDSLRAAGMGDGEIMLGGQKVIVNGTRAVLAEGGNLAGSVCSLMDCLRIAVKRMAIPLESAVRCATYNPARVIGAEDVCGRIAPGRKADLVVMDQGLGVRAVYKRGCKII